MKTETNSMRIVKPEKESEKAVVEPQKEKATGKPKYIQTRGTRHTRNCSGRCRVHPLHGCMQIAQHQQLNVKEHACGARNPILQTGWDISLQQRRNHELPRIQLQ